jgi:transcriptional regulator with XRE-family HTH domain
VQKKGKSFLAKEIIRLRRLKGWSPEDLSDRSGVSASTIKKVESGEIKDPRFETVCKILKPLGVSIKELITGKHPLGIGEDQLHSMFGTMHRESREILEEVLDERQGRSYLLEQARFWLSRRKKAD